MYVESSLPSRERELKLRQLFKAVYTIKVAPFTGARVETNLPDFGLVFAACRSLHGSAS